MTRQQLDPAMILFDPSISDSSLTEMLVDEYYLYILRLVRSILNNEVEAEDVAQETFVTALTRIDKLSTHDNIKAWLSTIAVNKCRDLLRKRKFKQSLQKDVWALFTFRERSKAPEETAVYNETATRLWQAVDQLKDKHRLPILLRYIHNLSIREIAEILGTKEGTIHSRLHYACRKLAQQLELPTPTPFMSEGVSR